MHAGFLQNAATRFRSSARGLGPEASYPNPEPGPMGVGVRRCKWSRSIVLAICFELEAVLTEYRVC